MDEPTTNNGGEHTGRVWRACLECRKKKSKCDGKDVCRPCRTRNRECIYPESKDNASSSRQFAATLDARCQQMDSLCQRMDILMGKFNEIAESLGCLRRADLVSAIPTAPANTVHEETGTMQQRIDSFLLNEGLDMSADMGHEAMDEDAEEEETGDESSSGAESKTQDHVMTTDSYGKLRYVGGTGTMVMIEALKSLSPESLAQSSIDSRSFEKVSVSKLELPFFVRGQTWPKLPFLPQAEQLLRPPRYVSDLLINLYFDQLHFTMPVIYRPHFMQRYNLLLNNRPDSPPDTAFLSVFFAVCACASGLLPREPGNSFMFTGLKYYESALLLHYAATGEGSIEQVQCLALLSMCTAGWNTLAQSWKFAGQAVRAAQDLGLHRSPARGACEVLKEELCRRIWWSIYCLDRLLSICLGRPMGVEDSDCDCEFPLDMDDGELEIYCKQSPETRRLPQGTSRLAGFISLSKLCRISGKIVHAMNPLKAHRRRKGYAAAQLRIAAALDTELREWLETIPDSVKFSANNTMDLDFGSPHLTMCAIIYVVHVGSVINLHQPLIPDKDHGSSTVSENPSFKQCIHAAGGCIRAGELLQERVPPSHHLAFCTHYLALSGVFLIRSSQCSKEDYTTDIETCIRSLASLETVWTGAKRSRLILEELMKHSGTPKNIDWGLVGDFAPPPHDELTEYMLRQETNDFNFGGLEFA